MRFISAILLFLMHRCIAKDSPTVKIDQGSLKGSLRETRSGKSFLSFQGIPYAEPPVENLRFEEPLPSKPWLEILDATKEHPPCVQLNGLFNNFTVFGDEDCLFLNVYTPKITSDLLPVIFYIHGGGFQQGNANPSLWGPDIILDKNVVFVTTNYRLGALGFLSTGDNVVPGNNGLKDQSLALKWVKNNIRQFGGNPEKITISGQSAGGASVYYHLLSPLSKDIPYAAMSLSGIAPALWSLAQKGEGRRSARNLAKSFNCSTDSSRIMIDCLKNLPARDIVGQAVKFMVFNYDPYLLYKPVVEQYSDGAFLPEDPIQIIKSGKMSQVPFMTGITTDDGAMKSTGVYNNSALVEKLISNFDEYLPMFLHFDEVGFNTIEISQAIKKFYFKDEDIRSAKNKLTDLVTDALFFVSARLTSVLHAKYSKYPVYFYLFGYRGSTSYSKRFGDPDHNYGVCHCDDLLYLISNSYAKHVPTREDLRMTELMTTIWYNFASTGNPTPELNTLVSTKWDPVVSDNLEYYFIKSSDSLEMHKNLYEERFQFWKKLSIINTNDNIKDEL